MGIRDLKELRRRNLATLRKEMTPAALAKATGISVAQLYQMSEATGDSLRNVSDSTARKIEAKCHLEHGWMDKDHDTPATARPVAKRKAASAVVLHITQSDIDSLDDSQRRTIVPLVNVIRDAISRPELPRSKSGPKSAA